MTEGDTTLPLWQKIKGNVKASPKLIYNLIRAEIVLIRADIKTLKTEQAAEQKPIAIVAVNVSATNTNGSSAADSTLVGASVVGIVPAGNQDQLVDNVEVEADGKIKVTLAAAATAQNQFKVSVLKA